MTEQIYTEEQLDAMSQEELQTEYKRVKGIAKFYCEPEHRDWKKYFRLIHRYGNLITRIGGEK